MADSETSLQRSMEIRGQVGCARARRDVANYRDTMASVTNFEKWVAAPAPEQNEYDKVTQQVAMTFEQLTRVSRSQSSK